MDPWTVVTAAAEAVNTGAVPSAQAYVPEQQGGAVTSPGYNWCSVSAADQASSVIDEALGGEGGVCDPDKEDVNGRWVLEPEDVMLLERVFALERCPGRELRTQLAERLKVRPRQVQVWFQNKRQRTKNSSQKPTLAESMVHAVASGGGAEGGESRPAAEMLLDMVGTIEARD